jgi:hypothetical protein
MKYLIEATSFAAPFVSDTSTRLVEAASPREALESFAASYSHPAGLYAANCYASAESYHEGAKPLARWRSNLEQAREAATKGMSAYSYCNHGNGTIEINGKGMTVLNPRGGSVVA